MSTLSTYILPSKEQLQACSLSIHQDLLAVACRSHIQLHRISPANGISPALISLQLSKQRGDTSFTVTDVQWSHAEPSYFATSTTNGNISIFNLEKDGNGKKIQLSSEQSTRAVNRVSWSPFEAFTLAAANQDSTVKVYDSRLEGDRACVASLLPRSDACRDIQFSPHDSNFFAAVFESGNLFLWDKRNTDSPYMKVVGAHTSNCLALSWCLTKNWRIATGGRDKNVKIWDICRSSPEGDVAHSSAAVTRPVHVLHTPYGVGRLAWRPALSVGANRQCMQLAATSVERGEISVWDVASPHVPACILKGHTEACTGLSWIDTSMTDFESVQYKLLMKESKESKAGGSGSVASVDDGAIRDQQQRSIGVNQHVISIQKDGKILVQDLRNGYFPRQHMASSVIAISSQGHVAYQTGKIDRGDPLGLFVSTDRGGSADVQTVTKRLIEAPELFKEDQKLFGLPLTDRFLNMSESVSQSQPCTSAQEVLCDASKSTGGTGQAAICSSDNKDAERVDVSSDPPKSSATARTPLFFSRMQQRKPLYPDAKKEAVPTSPGRPKARRASAEYPSSASIENISTIHKSGLVYVGLAEIESFTAAHEICQGDKGGGAEGGAFDPAIISLLAKFYCMGREQEVDWNRSLTSELDEGLEGIVEDKEYLLRLLYEKDEPAMRDRGDSSASLSSHHSQIDCARFACRHNYNVAKSVGLQSHAAIWETLLILIPAFAQIDGQKDSSALSFDYPFPTQVAADIVGSCLTQFLENGDCQHFVVFCEVLRNSGLLNAATSTIPEIGSLRQREAYVTYIDLLTKLELYDATNVLLKHSSDEYISALNKKGSLLHITCSKCGKELSSTADLGDSLSQSASGGSYCVKCRKCVGLCSLCCKLVSGLYLWCPICCHGGHSQCVKSWFLNHSQCPSGCGHPCQLSSTSEPTSTHVAHVPIALNDRDNTMQ